MSTKKVCMVNGEEAPPSSAAKKGATVEETPSTTGVSSTVAPSTGGRRKRGGANNVLKVECKNSSSEIETEFDKLKQGGADIKMRYKKSLNKKTVEDLRKMAKGKGIKVTTKKDGKAVYLKKASIINKLCDYKHPKKTAKKVTKKTTKKAPKRK